MNFGKILDLISKNNVDPEKVFLLVDKIKNSDLSNEDTIRGIIKEVALLTGKTIDKLQEDAIVKKVQKDGINESLLNDFKWFKPLLRGFYFY